MSEEKDWLEGWDRSCFQLSSMFAEPLYRAYGLFRYRLISPLTPNEFDNTTERTSEIGQRALTVFKASLLFIIGAVHLVLVGGILAAPMAIFRALGCALQKNHYTHVKGKAEESLQKEISILTWNLQGQAGGVHYTHGVCHWSSRIDAILKEVKEKSPDVLVLLNVKDTKFGESLIESLQNEYAHFYFHIGANWKGDNTGTFIATKHAVADFSHTPFHTDNAHGFETFTLKKDPSDHQGSIRIVGANLSSHDQEKGLTLQATQFTQMKEFLQQIQGPPMPTFLVGNLQMDREKAGPILSQSLLHMYREEKPLSSEKLGKKWSASYSEPGDKTLYISLFQKKAFLPHAPLKETELSQVQTRLIEAFDNPEDPSSKNSLSNQRGIWVKFALQKSKRSSTNPSNMPAFNSAQQN